MEMERPWNLRFSPIEIEEIPSAGVVPSSFSKIARSFGEAPLIGMPLVFSLGANGSRTG